MSEILLKGSGVLVIFFYMPINHYYYLLIQPFIVSIDIIKTAYIKFEH